MTRFIGAETEYGIATPGHNFLSPIITSTHAVVAFAAAQGGGTHRTRWDHAPETPLKDTRGFDLRRYHRPPDLEPNALGVANVFLNNGGRFYVDHAHPEYSSPEVTNAWDAMVFDAAGDDILNQAVAAVAEVTAAGKSVLDTHPPCPALKMYKNNVDGKGASYGSHENYRYSRATDFDALAQALIPFFVARQVIIGAGRVGLGQNGENPGFQISQRADYIEQEISLETTLNRGIINTRDEPHTSAEDFGRLHVIIGDANMSQTSNLLKFGMTALVLDAIEAGVDFSDLALSHAVAEVSAVSRDLTLQHRLQLVDGRQLTALDILRQYRERVNATTDVDGKVLQTWDEVMNLLEKDPLSTAHLLDWTAKWALISSYVDRGLSLDDAKVKLIDLQYSDIDPTRSLHHALVRKGRMTQLVSASDVAQAAQQPPADTRAFFRGVVLDRFGSAVLAANWESLVLTAQDDTVVRVDLSSLDALTDTHFQEQLLVAKDSASVIALVKEQGLATVSPV